MFGVLVCFELFLWLFETLIIVIGMGTGLKCIYDLCFLVNSFHIFSYRKKYRTNERTQFLESNKSEFRPRQPHYQAFYISQL